MPDTVELGETAPHGKGARRAFGLARAFPATETRDDPGGPGEGPWRMGIFLPVGASFILELKGGEEFDLAGFEEVASGLGHLAVAGAFRSQRPNATSSATPHDNSRRQTPNCSDIRCESNAPFLQSFVAEAANLPAGKFHCRPPESVGKHRVTHLMTNTTSFRWLSQSVAPDEKCS
jgi:hypothetical protein